MGYTRSLGTDISEDMYLIKINTNGTVIWQKTYGLTNVDEQGYAIMRMHECGYTAVGQREKSDGSHEVFIVKIDENGEVL